MHILLGVLIGLGVATALIIMWAQGNPIACVFLSIPTGLALLIFTFQDAARSPQHVDNALLCIVILVFVWLPHSSIRHRNARNARHYLPRGDVAAKAWRGTLDAVVLGVALVAARPQLVCKSRHAGCL